MAQSLGFDPTLKVKICFDCKMFDVENWVTSLNGEDGPGGTPSLEALSVSPQGALEISSLVGQPPSLVRDHFSSPRVVAKIHPKTTVSKSLDASNQGWGAYLEQVSTKGLWSGKKGYT